MAIFLLGGWAAFVFWAMRSSGPAKFLAVLVTVPMVGLLALYAFAVIVLDHHHRLF